MTNKLSRRQFLRMGATGAAATTLGSGLLPSLAQDDIVLQWWDHFLPLQPLSESVFAAYNEANPNVSVEYTVFSPPDLGKSLQLAFPNGQAPDIHALAGVNLPLPALHKEGWFTPIGPYVTEEWMASLPPEVLIEAARPLAASSTASRSSASASMPSSPGSTCPSWKPPASTRRSAR